MKMKFIVRVRSTGNSQIFEAKNHSKAFDICVEKYGVDGFTSLNRYFDGATKADHERHFLGRAISNVIKYLHSVNRKGFK